MRYFLDRSVTIRRLRRIDLNRSSYSATATALQCSFQDLGPEKSNMFAGEIAQLYEVYVNDSNADIDVADDVVINELLYSVRAKEVIDFGGNPYIMLLVAKHDTG